MFGIVFVAPMDSHSSEKEDVRMIYQIPLLITLSFLSQFSILWKLLSEISFKRHSRLINFWKNASKVEATSGEIFSIITIVFNQHSDNNIIIKIKTLNFGEKPKISYDIHLD